METQQFNGIWIPTAEITPLAILEKIKLVPSFSGKTLIAHPALRIEAFCFAGPAKVDYIEIPVDVPFVMTSGEDFNVLVPVIEEVKVKEGKLMFGGEYRITDATAPTLSVVAIMLNNEGSVLPYPLAGVVLSGMVFVE